MRSNYRSTTMSCRILAATAYISDQNRYFENPNPDSCFYFKAANSLLKLKRSTSCKTKNKKKKLA